MPVAAFLDESRSNKHHPMLSVGGFVMDLDDVPALESAWADAKVAVGLAVDAPVRYAQTWDDHTLRLPLIQQIAQLGVPIKAVAALLEDFRPEHYTQKKETRKDMYVQRRAFEYVLQRLAEQQFLPADARGPHLVFADRHDDFRCYDEEYAKAWRDGWYFQAYDRSVSPLRDLGFASAASAMSAGPMMEIADLIASVATRWTEAMVAGMRSRDVSDLAELEAAMLSLIPLFPQNPRSVLSWRGYGIVAHRDRRHGKEVVYDNIDRWLRELMRRGGTLAA